MKPIRKTALLLWKKPGKGRGRYRNPPRKENTCWKRKPCRERNQEEKTKTWREKNPLQIERKSCKFERKSYQNQVID
jgi:hypothetical protein